MNASWVGDRLELRATVHLDLETMELRYALPQRAEHEALPSWNPDGRYVLRRDVAAVGHEVRDRGSWSWGRIEEARRWSRSGESHGTNRDNVEQALDAVLSVGKSEDVSADLGECAVAAAEVLARLIRPSDDENPYAEAVAEWVRAHRIVPTGDIVRKAITVLDRVAMAPSELLELWDETKAAGDWTAAIRHLKGRLRGDAG